MTFREIFLNIRDLCPDISVPVIKQHINMVYQDILGKEKWEFMNDDTTVNLTGIKENTTSESIQVVNGDTGVTGTGTSFSSDVEAGMGFRVGSESEFYLVSSVTDDTNLVLETAYGGTSQSGADFSAFKHIYSVGSDCAEIQAMVYQDRIKERPLSFFNWNYPERSSTGSPEYYRIVDKSRAGTGTITFEICPVPDQDYTIRVYYKKYVSNITSDTSEPVFRGDLIIAGVLKNLYRIEFTKTKNPTYIGLQRDAAQEYYRMLREMILEDLDTSSIPEQVIDSESMLVRDNNFWTKHDID